MWTPVVALGAFVLALVPIRIRVVMAFDLLGQQAAIKIRFAFLSLRLMVRQDGQIVLQGKRLGTKRAKTGGRKVDKGLVRRIFQALRVRGDLHVLVGFPSRQTTALVCALLSLVPQGDLSVRAFAAQEEVCKGYVRCALSLRLARLLS